jgi:subtilisin family serine protease
MDGKTAITTIAANMAEDYGLIICNSAGNERYNKDHNTLNAPADGKYVITVGGVNTLGDRVSSSSVGPTADGRIKPDIMAMGSGVYRASSSSDYQFSVASGTSMASPLVAGSIALLLEAFPELTPAEVRNAIKKTASQASNPDNLMGHGILNISAAYDYVLNDTIFAPDNFFLAQNEPNPFNGFTRIKYGVRNESRVKLSIYDVLGRLVFAFPSKVVSGNASELITDRQLGATGVYFYTVAGKDLITGRSFNNSRKMVYIK